MEKKFRGFAESAQEAGKVAAGILGKAKNTVVRVVDQNDDGEFDIKDVSVIANTIGSAAKKTAAVVQETAEAKKREYDEKVFRPIFADNLDDADFVLPKLIRITEMDKKRAKSEVCKGSIGYYTDIDETKIVNIFRENIDYFGITLFPNADGEIYYADPSDRDHYISLDDYFGYLKQARVNELQKIAQDLGAKHFKVTFKEQKTTFAERRIKGNAKVADRGAVDAEMELTSTEVSIAEIAAETDYPGHAPVEPKLRYLQREPSIQTLISLRMDKDAPISHQKYTLKLSNSSGIKEKDAVKIDAVLKALKITGNATVVSEAKSEARRFFEYEIDF